MRHNCLNTRRHFSQDRVLQLQNVAKNLIIILPIIIIIIIIDVAILGDRNVIKKEAEKNYKI
jgi:hypothetical protein